MTEKLERKIFCDVCGNECGHLNVGRAFRLQGQNVSPSEHGGIIMRVTVEPATVGMDQRSIDHVCNQCIKQALTRANSMLSGQPFITRQS